MNGLALKEFASYETIEIDLGMLGESTYAFDIAGSNSTTIQAANTSGAWGSAVLTVERSNDGEQWFGLSCEVTISSDGIYAIRPFTKWVRVTVTTAGTAGHRATVTVYSQLS